MKDEGKVNTSWRGVNRRSSQSQQVLRGKGVAIWVYAPGPKEELYRQVWVAIWVPGVVVIPEAAYFRSENERYINLATQLIAEIKALKKDLIKICAPEKYSKQAEHLERINKMLMSKRKKKRIKNENIERECDVSRAVYEELLYIKGHFEKLLTSANSEQDYYKEYPEKNHKIISSGIKLVDETMRLIEKLKTTYNNESDFNVNYIRSLDIQKLLLNQKPPADGSNIKTIHDSNRQLVVEQHSIFLHFNNLYNNYTFSCSQIDEFIGSAKRALAEVGVIRQTLLNTPLASNPEFLEKSSKAAAIRETTLSYKDLEPQTLHITVIENLYNSTQLLKKNAESIRTYFRNISLPSNHLNRKTINKHSGFSNIHL